MQDNINNHISLEMSLFITKNGYALCFQMQINFANTNYLTKDLK